eukprot:TRINITY_DN78715_c0_g1_i1.p1 TRINITY_DN78715_c0_g1~~TRINITY_DN78715_c0_g1_i1.p1  ORF type:complete len:238 (-),score=57.03 TRINITY_DN78715_c0_g1_i1:43-756(-)
MGESVYRKTALPVRLNLNDRNTKEQLTGPAPEHNARGALEGVGVASSTHQSQKDSVEVMRKDLCTWLTNHGIDGPPPSIEAEQRAMWQWIRDFHSEYNDDWFARNMARMIERFKPVFVSEMKRMKAARASAAAEAAPVAVPEKTEDLLSLDAEPQQSPQVAYSSQAASTPMPAAATAAPTLGGDLLDLDLGGPPAPTGPAQTPHTSDLLCDPLAVATPAAAQAPPASKTDNLLDLMM